MSNWFEQRLGPPQQTVRYQPGQPWPPVPQPAPTMPPQYVNRGGGTVTGQLVINNAAELLLYKDLWQGTAEEKLNTEVCPKCGGPLQMFTQDGAPKIMNRDGVKCRPMERCHYCGYNGHFEQLGQQLTDGGVVVKVLG